MTTTLVIEFNSGVPQERVVADNFDVQDGLIRFYTMVPIPPEQKVVVHEGQTHQRQYHTFIPQSSIRKIVRAE